MKSLLLPLAVCAALGGCAVYGDPGYGYYGSGYGYSSYGYPGYGTYGTYGVYQSSPVVVYPGYGERRYRDRDRDGIRNRMDRDRDGDGVPNRFDDRPNNPRRR